MSKHKIWIYGAVLFFSVSTILTTQVTWIIQSVNIEESFLNQRVSMALCSAMDVLSKDKGICSGAESCIAHAAGTFELTMNQLEKVKMDSVIHQHLLFYNIDVPFQTTFSPYVDKGELKALPAGQALLYPVAEAGMQNILVHIEIPSKNDLIRKKLNGTFILSILVLGLLTVVFLRALRSLARERNIRRETVDFVNTMAHDLKTPISNISFALSMYMRENKNTGEPASQYLSIIGTETGILKQRARQILGAASIDAVIEDESKKAEVDIHKLIDKVIQAFSLQLLEVKGEICLQLDAMRPIVTGNQLQLASAVMNIVDNAITYSISSPAIQITTRNSDNSISIDIKDNGPGIPEREQEMVFKKGYRVHHANANKEGYGLGLYLAKSLVEKQGGDLSLSSDGHNGSAFTIRLPLA